MDVCAGVGDATVFGADVKLAGPGPRTELTGTLHAEGLETERTEKHQFWYRQY